MKTMRLLLIAFILNIAAFASIGKISALNGDVSIIRASKTLKASAGSALEQKDIVKASKGSAAQIVFNDKTVITVGSATTFKIEEYLFDDKTPNAKFKVEEGSFKAITGKIGKIAPDKFKLETKTATIGIRGTAFVGRTDINGNLIVACTRGAIVVTPLGIFQAPPPPVIVPAGQMTNANQNGVEPPHPFTPNDLRDLNGDMNGYAKNNQGNGNNQGGNNQDNKDNKTAGVDNSVKDTVSDISSKIVDSKNNDAVSSSGDWAAAYGVDYVPGTRYVVTGKNVNFYNGEGMDYFDSIGSFSYTYGGDTNSSVTSQTVTGEDKAKIVLNGTPYGYNVGSYTTTITTESDSSDYVSWGYWESKSSSNSLYYEYGYWVGGALTAINDVPQSGSASYSGKVLGGVINGYSFDKIVSSTSSVNLNVNFGSTSSITGNIAFATEGGQAWNLAVSNGSVSGNSLSGSINSGSLNGNVAEITNGTYSGNFYGPKAVSAAGAFKATATDGQSNSYTAAGVFKANKQ